MSNHPQKSGSLCSGMSGSLCSGIGGSLYSGIGGSLYPGILTTKKMQHCTEKDRKSTSIFLAPSSGSGATTTPTSMDWKKLEVNTL